MSLMTTIRLSPLERITSVNSRWSLLSGVSSSKLVMPITPFIGVRISWLMVARNADLACASCSAASAASCNERSYFFCAVTSRPRLI